MTSPERTDLEIVTDEARQAPVPDVDWEQVERALMQSVEREPRPSARRPLAAWLAAAAVVLGGAAAVVATLPDEAPIAHAPAPVEPAPVATPAAVDGNALPVGAKIETAQAPRTVEHRGRATWTLEPGSIAVVERAGEVIQLALEQGAVSARVVPRSVPETFVVRADRARFAVHGTAFRVERHDGTVRIRVDEGTVAAGPVGGTPFLLTAPAESVLTLAGERFVEGTPAPAPAAKAAPPRTAHPARAVGREAIDQALSRVVPEVRRCFSANTASGGDLSIVAKTHLSLAVLPDGSIRELRFSPPLSPAVSSCADSALASVRVTRSDEGFVAERDLELSP